MGTKSMTPLPLVKLILLGTLLIDASWGLDFLPFREPSLHSGLLSAALTIGPVILLAGVFLTGALLLWRAGKRLSDGVRIGAWTEEQLTSAREWADSTALSWYIWLLLLGSVVIMVLGHILHFRWNTLVLIYSTYPLSWMKVKLRKPPPPREPEDWRDRPRFFSNHWGEPPADSSGNSSV